MRSDLLRQPSSASAAHAACALRARQPSFPPGMFAPYQIRLDNDHLIFAPVDEDRVVREYIGDTGYTEWLAPDELMSKPLTEVVALLKHAGSDQLASYLLYAIVEGIEKASDVAQDSGVARMCDFVRAGGVDGLMTALRRFSDSDVVILPAMAVIDCRGQRPKGQVAVYQPRRTCDPRGGGLGLPGQRGSGLACNRRGAQYLCRRLGGVHRAQARVHPRGPTAARAPRHATAPARRGHAGIRLVGSGQSHLTPHIRGVAAPKGFEPARAPTTLTSDTILTPSNMPNIGTRGGRSHGRGAQGPAAGSGACDACASLHGEHGARPLRTRD